MKFTSPWAQFFRMVGRQARREALLDVKHRLWAHGFRYQLSLWGTLKALGPDGERWRRAEFLAQAPWSPREVQALLAFLTQHPPPTDYQVYAYHAGQLYVPHGEVGAWQSSLGAASPAS